MARQEGRKITEFDALDIVVSRLIGIPLEKIAEVYGVSKQAVLYHENKNHVLDFGLSSYDERQRLLGMK